MSLLELHNLCLIRFRVFGWLVGLSWVGFFVTVFFCVALAVLLHLYVSVGLYI